MEPSSSSNKVDEISQLKQDISKLPGKDNAKARQKLNKRLRYLQTSNAPSSSVPEVTFTKHGGDDAGSNQPQQQQQRQTPGRRRRVRSEKARGGAQQQQHQPQQQQQQQQHQQPDGKAPGTPRRNTIRRRGQPQHQNQNRNNNRRSVSANEYVIKEKVGKGSFATCYRAEHRTTKEVACMKQIDLCVKKCDVPDVRDELKYLNKLNHVNCLSLFAFNVDINLVVTMILEFCPYSLEDIRVACDKKESIRTRIDFQVARKAFYQIIQGVKYLHNFSATETIAHFDLKPDNVMSTQNGILKLADFGLAYTLKGKEALVTDGLYRGTEEYMAPEVNGAQTAYGIKADIWSMGAMFYELVFGRLAKPSRESYQRRIFEALQKSNMVEGENVVTLVSFFDICFKIKPTERATIEELEDHPLFKKVTKKESMEAVVAEIAVVSMLKSVHELAIKNYVEVGALPDLDLEDSSDSSSSDSSSNSDDEDEEDEDEEEIDDDDDEEVEEDEDEDENEDEGGDVAVIIADNGADDEEEDEGDEDDKEGDDDEDDDDGDDAGNDVKNNDDDDDNDAQEDEVDAPDTQVEEKKEEQEQVVSVVDSQC